MILLMMVPVLKLIVLKIKLEILHGEYDTSKDVHWHLFKHAAESGHEVLNVTNYSIIEKGYQNNTRKHKIAYALLIKEIRPTLNRKDQSRALKLFN